MIGYAKSIADASKFHRLADLVKEMHQATKDDPKRAAEAFADLANSIDFLRATDLDNFHAWANSMFIDACGPIGPIGPFTEVSRSEAED